MSQETLLRYEGLVPWTTTPTNHWHYVPTSHDGIRHDSVSNLGFDWSKTADPDIAARMPFKVYLPRTTEDVVAILQETRGEGTPVVVRGQGHSSNNLVTPERGAVVLTQLMDRVLDVDESAMVVTVQGGAALMAVDLYLSERGLGLPIIGDHDGITAAGFASVGGVSPASLRYGMFVDTVAALEYVDWTGKVHRCGRAQHREDLLRMLCGTGRHGIITELTIDVIRVDKFRTIFDNRRHLSLSVSDFVRHSAEFIRRPGGAVMAHGIWADAALPGRLGLPDAHLRFGQFYSYHPTTQRLYKSAWNRLAFGLQQSIGYVAGRLPGPVDDALKYVGMAAIMASPRYAAMKNVERYTDQVIDATVGDPTRWFVVLAPAERYETLFYQLYELFTTERERSRAMTFIALYVKAVRSAYLSGTQTGEPPLPYCELLVQVGIRPERMTPGVLERLVSRIDRLTIAAGGWRYLHSLTSSDPDIREQVDPNSRYTTPEAAAETARVTAVDGAA
jgi:hypothetical protein